MLLICGLFALVTGAISLRTSGVYFIMITLAFGQMLFFSLSSLSSYGGDDGLTLWDTPTFFGTTPFLNGSGLFYSTLVILIATWLFVGRLSVSRFGRVLRAGKQNALRVGTVGFDIFRYRLVAYVIAGCSPVSPAFSPPVMPSISARRPPPGRTPATSSSWWCSAAWAPAMARSSVPCSWC